jgi:8-oxo-dGTP diphosphatase
MYYFYDRSGQMISLTFNREKFLPDAGHVLVWAFADDEKKTIVLTRHRRRGWEVPGGKVDAGESPENAAHRELFEETGVKIESLRWIGQYVIHPVDKGEPAVKNIYMGRVREWGDIPKGFETLERGIFLIDLMPFQAGMSPFIQDNIFPLCRIMIEAQKCV